MSFSDSTESINTWGDAWGGVNQRGTVWSLQKGNNNDIYEVNVK